MNIFGSSAYLCRTQPLYGMYAGAESGYQLLYCRMASHLLCSGLRHLNFRSKRDFFFPRHIILFLVTLSINTKQGVLALDLGRLATGYGMGVFSYVVEF